MSRKLLITIKSQGKNLEQGASYILDLTDTKSRLGLLHHINDFLRGIGIKSGLVIDSLAQEAVNAGEYVPESILEVGPNTDGED